MDCMRHLLFFSVVCLVVACGGRQQRQPDATVEPAHIPRVFLPAIPPSRLTAEEATEWMRWHYWDKFDFADTLFIAEIDTAQMVQAYARYISLLSMKPTDGAPIDSLMRRASSSRQMHDYFAWLGEEILHGPNSPLRSDEFYIPVLQSILASPYYDEYERIAPAYDLKLASQNRLGRPANDFRYTLASGVTGSL